MESGFCQNLFLLEESVNLGRRLAPLVGAGVNHVDEEFKFVFSHGIGIFRRRMRAGVLLGLEARLFTVIVGIEKFSQIVDIGERVF